MKNGFFILISMILFSTNTSWGQEIKSVNFLQEGDVSKLVIEVDKPIVADRLHVKDDKQIILDLKNVKIDKKLLRGIDTSEFDGATVYISGYPKPGATNDIRFAVQLRDNVRSILDSQGNKIVLSIENRFGVFSKSKLKETETTMVKTTEQGKTEKIEDSVHLNVPKSASIEDILENLTLSGPKKYIGKKISINVKDIPLPDLLRMIADTSGFNIIIDADITKVAPLTLSLTNIPWDQALDTILALSKLVATKNSNILSVTTIEKATTEREADAKAQQLKLGLEPLVTKVFPISYAEMADLKKILTDYLTPTRGTMSDDPRTNSLIVKDTVDSIERIKKIVELLDTQTPQILIEAKIVEASEAYGKRIGLSNGLTFGYDPVVDITTVTNRGPGFSFSTASGGTGGSALGINIASFKRLGNLSAALELMESESKVRIVTAPKVITQNKKPANITSTETTSFLVTTVANGATTQAFQTIPVSVNLTVTPQVTNEGAINMDVQLSKGAFGDRPGANAPPNTTTRQLKTNVLVDNGSTVVLGGLYGTTSTESHSGIPFLKDLPLVGWLFRTPYNPTNTRSELLIFLTPRIINQEEAGLIDRQNSSSAKM
ncbi:MAG: type IV pilus secretin PilQ [Bacteriovoracaceae bacterium]|nr:type IV pilus secretin PilQ [Bacteriovoracaceae bacterium]